MSDSIFSLHDLAALFDAFNRHDINGVMKYLAPECVFNAVAGADVCGRRIEGAGAIAAAFAGVWTTSADARWEHHSHFAMVTVRCRSGRSLRPIPTAAVSKPKDATCSRCAMARSCGSRRFASTDRLSGDEPRGSS